nr:galactocerebrosidase [Biomphalaria glabrata]
MHKSNDENYERGYELWLMVKAKKRNRNIKLYGLPWAFSGWIGQGTHNPYTNVSLTAYIVQCITGAKRRHNLTIGLHWDFAFWKVLCKSESVHSCHYPSTYDSPEAYITGKSLSASEDYSICNAANGGGCWARLMTTLFV